MQFFYEKKLLWIFLNLLNPTSILCCCSFTILCTFDEGHMERWRTWKDINCPSDRANPILEPTRRLIKREPGTCSAEKLASNSRQNLCCRYWGFWRAPQETPGKEIWCQKETNAMTTAGTNSPRCRVRPCRLMIKKK